MPANAAAQCRSCLVRNLACCSWVTAARRRPHQELGKEHLAPQQWRGKVNGGRVCSWGLMQNTDWVVCGCGSTQKRTRPFSPKSFPAPKPKLHLAVSSRLAPRRHNSSFVTWSASHVLVVLAAVNPRIANRVQQEPSSGRAGNCTMLLLIFSPEVELDLDCTPPSQPVLRTPIRTCCSWGLELCVSRLKSSPVSQQMLTAGRWQRLWLRVQTPRLQSPHSTALPNKQGLALITRPSPLLAEPF